MFGELNQCTIQLLSRKGGSEIIPTRIKHAYFSVRCTTQQWRSYHKVKLVFLCLNSLAPSYFLAFFIRFSNIHSYSTRQSSRLLLPRVKSNFGKNTFLFSGAKIFNELPTDITKAEDTQTFCRRAKGFLLS